MRRSRTRGHVPTTALAQNISFELTCEDADRTTRYMAVSRVSIVPRPFRSSLTDVLCSGNGGLTLPRRDEGDRWTPTEETDRWTGRRDRTGTVSQLHGCGHSGPLIRLWGRK